MPPRRNKKKFQQLTESERGRIIVLREGGFYYRSIGARVQRNSSTVMRVWKQWTDEHRTTRKTGIGRRKVTSACDDRHLAVNGRTASSRQLAARWSTATGVLMSTSSIRRNLMHRGMRVRVPLYRIPSRQTIDGYVCNVLMSTEPDELIGTKLAFQRNPASICGIMMAAFVLEAMTMNTALQNALSNDIVA
ncbi:uncharacterized protein TNCV_3599511 [Trichonephila clavipes]|nr:uncharacterized protein TNCV_3599511 [Trichonephila clavipes]